MVKGDISSSLLDLIDTVESFQKEHDSYYGTIDSDFRMVLLYICLEINLIKEFPVEIEDLQIFDTIQLKKIILTILTKHYAYFTDSEACWVPFENRSKRLKNFEEMNHFFSSGVEKKPDDVRAFLARSSWSPSIMVECLAHGGYIDTTWDNSIDWNEVKNALNF